MSDCQHCKNGSAPRHGHIERQGRARYICRECGRDVSMALFMLADAELRKWKRSMK